MIIAASAERTESNAADDHLGEENMDNQTNPMMAVGISAVPIIIILLLVALIMSKLAPRVGSSSVAWFILTIIPLVNFFFLYYAAYKILAHILDRLNELSSRPRPI
jgi:putative exporter of polyketide antibiotics